MSLSLVALAPGGIPTRSDFLRILISGILARVKHGVSLVATTIVTCFCYLFCRHPGKFTLMPT
ncbi:MAG: hypothetical protein OIF57_02600 [Marinobacterium sp.]|nr:hypothetical protein [Marinobacterium sp.]